jgi:hypothetical protein
MVHFDEAKIGEIQKYYQQHRSHKKCIAEFGITGSQSWAINTFAIKHKIPTSDVASVLNNMPEQVDTIGDIAVHFGFEPEASLI